MGGVFVAFERLAITLEPVIDGSLADVGIGEGIVQRDGMVITGESFVQTAELFEGRGLFYVGPGMVSIKGEHFLEADEGATRLFHVEQVFTGLQQRREALGDSAGGRRHRNRSQPTLDRSQSGSHVKQHGYYAGRQKHSNRDRNFEPGDEKADGFRVLPLGILDRLQGLLLLGLNLADHLESKARQTRFIIVRGRDDGSGDVCRSRCGGGRKKRDNGAG